MPLATHKFLEINPRGESAPRTNRPRPGQLPSKLQIDKPACSSSREAGQFRQREWQPLNHANLFFRGVKRQHFLSEGRSCCSEVSCRRGRLACCLSSSRSWSGQAHKESSRRLRPVLLQPLSSAGLSTPAPRPTCWILLRMWGPRCSLFRLLAIRPKSDPRQAVGRSESVDFRIRDDCTEQDRARNYHSD